jgi:hypothetical protein
MNPGSGFLESGPTAVRVRCGRRNTGASLLPYLCAEFPTGESYKLRLGCRAVNHEGSPRWWL